jgi:hypothetical protein
MSCASLKSQPTENADYCSKFTAMTPDSEDTNVIRSGSLSHLFVTQIADNMRTYKKYCLINKR